MLSFIVLRLHVFDLVFLLPFYLGSPSLISIFQLEPASVAVQKKSFLILAPKLFWASTDPETIYLLQQSRPSLSLMVFTSENSAAERAFRCFSTARLQASVAPAKD